MTETQLQEAVIECAQTFGWLVAHFRPAKTERGWRTAVSADGAGYPDLTMVRGDRLLFVELKSARGVLSDPQKLWREKLQAATPEVYTWEPSRWLDGTIERVLR